MSDWPQIFKIEVLDSLANCCFHSFHRSRIAPVDTPSLSAGGQGSDSQAHSSDLAATAALQSASGKSPAPQAYSLKRTCTATAPLQSAGGDGPVPEAHSCVLSATAAFHGPGGTGPVPKTHNLRCRVKTRSLPSPPPSSLTPCLWPPSFSKAKQCLDPRRGKQGAGSGLSPSLCFHNPCNKLA